MNEHAAPNPSSIAAWPVGELPLVDRHLSAREFRRWRNRHTFATPELAAQAELIELDLDLLPQLGPHNTDTRTAIKQRLAEFANAMAA